MAGMLSPSLDLSETPEAVQVRMDLPGMKPEDVNIEITGNTLRITGERKEGKEEKNKTYVERRLGSFSRSVALPCPVKESDVNAEYANGVLTVTMWKSEEAKAHKIKIKAK